MGLLAADMHHIKRHAGCIRDGDRAICGFTFEFRRTGIGMAFGPCYTLLEHLLLHIGHQITVFGMHHRQCSDFLTAFKAGKHFIIFDHQGAFIGHEMFERVDPHINRIFHPVEDLFIPAGDRHMIAYIRTDLRRGFAVPFVDCVFDRAICPWQAEIHHHRCAAYGGGPCARFKGFGRSCAHEGHFKMRMRINSARNNISAGGIDIFIAGQIFTDLFDGFAFDKDICLPGAVGRANGSAFDHFAHLGSPFMRGYSVMTAVSTTA